MASLLIEAATKGDIAFVRKAYEDNNVDPSSFFLGSSDNNGNRNFVHAAVEYGRYSFLFEALQLLSPHPELIIKLMCQTHLTRNPFHIVALRHSFYTLKLLGNAYTKALALVHNNQETAPWLVEQKNMFEGSTPIRCLFRNETEGTESLARYFVSLDENLFRTLGKEKYPMEICSTLSFSPSTEPSLLYLAAQNGYSLLVEQILTSDLPYSVSGWSNQTPLRYASRCNERASRLLLEKHPELISPRASFYDTTMLDIAVKDDATWLVRLMLTQEEGVPRVPWIKLCRRLVWNRDREGDTPLHVAAWNGNIEIAKILIQGYRSALQDEAEYSNDEADHDDLPEPGNNLVGYNPLWIENNVDDAPLIVALRKKHDDCGVMLAKESLPLGREYKVTDLCNKSLPVAIENGCLLSAKVILERIVHRDYQEGQLEKRLLDLGISSPGIIMMIRHITTKYPVALQMVKTEEFAKLLEAFPRFLKEVHKDAKTILKEAAERGEDWLVRLALDSDKSLYSESAPAWQVASKKGHLSTLLIFVEFNGPQEFIKLCKEKKQTPLHHVKFLQPEQYVKMLKMSVFDMLKNQTDSDGATPLHRAIQCENLELTKALMETKDTEVDIKDNKGITALDLLENSCQYSTTWGKMCREIKQDSTVKNLRHLFRKISFEGMQNTMSVVAALVATITFAAGFAVPGGPDSSNGTPVLATEAAFLAFSISNTISMCCSIMVLFLLLGPMMWDPHPSRFYVNLSISLLLTSLGGTVVAFMTGVYATMAPKAKWAAVFVIVSCSLALFMGCVVLLLTYSARSRVLLGKPFSSWLKMAASNVITSQRSAGTTSVVPATKEASPPSPALTENLNGEVDQSSGTPHPELDDLKIEIKAD